MRKILLFKKSIMKIPKSLFLLLAIAFLLSFSCSRNNEIQKDAEQIGEAMCRHIEIMSKLKIVGQDDTAASHKLQSDAKKLEEEMQILYKKFGDKYGDKTKNPDFKKKFSHDLRKAMLKCQYLSKEDRAQFEAELKE